MNDSEITEQFRVTRIIYSALILGVLIMFAISLFFVENKKVTPNPSLDEISKILIPIVGIVVMFLARGIYNKNISSIENNESLLTKISRYRTFKIVQWAQIESGSLISIVGFILTSNYLYAIVFLFLVGFFILIRPSKEQFVNDFKISSNQRKIININ